MSDSTPSAKEEESLASVLDKINKVPTKNAQSPPEASREEYISDFASYEAAPSSQLSESDYREESQAHRAAAKRGKSGRRRRSSSQSGTRTRREQAGSMLKIAIYGILGVIALLALVIVLMIVRQSTLQQEEKKRQYAQIAEQQAQAQQELRDNYTATRATPAAKKESKAEVVNREHKQRHGIPSFLGEDSDYSDKSQTPSLYNPSIFGLPSDTQPEDQAQD